MLKYLHIENIAVIESADLEPTEGFNTLTGETGAGKSIIIDAINAVLGERTSKELIRNGSDKAMVTAIFSRISTEAEKVLAENGLYPDEEGNLQVQRMLSSSGGSIRINGKPTTAQVLKVDYTGDGILVETIVDPILYGRLKDFITKEIK